ncbi:hypothetical protein BGW37DRAFT_558864 [Umbelopsis sp. PMI_123]|nr:hypothetical protein BGW37DRAFT_558864 [Umbelopsis sp. PMI_123]
MSSQQKIQSQLKETAVIQSELSSLKPSAAIYERKVNGSNIFFRAPDRNEVISSYKAKQTQLEKTLKEISKH